MVLLHALGERGTSWAPVQGRFAERFRVVTVDLRGHGDSDWPGTYSFQLMRDDVIDLLDHLGLRRVTVVGHSMGGAVAYLLAMQRADQVERLVVEDVPPPFRRDRPIPDRPVEPLDFDWAVVPAIIGQVNAGDPVTWDGLREITAPTLLIGGVLQSHIPRTSSPRQPRASPAARCSPSPPAMTFTQPAPPSSPIPFSTGSARESLTTSEQRQRGCHARPSPT